MKSLFQVILFLIFGMFNNMYCSIVEINNTSLVKIETNFDIVAYPDPKKTIGKNSHIKEDIGHFFMRGISIGVHIGDYFIDDILHEYLPQTLGLGDVSYIIFMGIENLGHTNFINEYMFAFTFYLVRNPRFLYSGGIVSKSNPIKVRTTNFESFTPVFSSNDNVSIMLNKDKKECSLQ